MDILLHTISLEPARWTPLRVSRPLVELLPRLARSKFKQLEIFEPHLALAPDEAAIREALKANGLEPVVLSSYLKIAGGPVDEFQREAGRLIDRVHAFGFRKVRLFFGPKTDLFTERLIELVSRAPEIEFLLETHDGSLADEPAAAVAVVEAAQCENLGLLFQPTFFEPEKTRAQFAVQKPLIRHVHLQNRDSACGFVRLAEGVIDWPELIRQLPAGVGASVEFVPVGICAPDEFDLDATLAEAEAEADFVSRSAV